MDRQTTNSQTFVQKLTEIVEANLKNEHFGVSELAKAIGTSRSSLYLKVNAITKKSVSRFIREVRLKKAMEMLEQSSLTVSEVAYEVGFGSPTYFIKCFHEYFGHPPGEVKKRDWTNSNSKDHTESLSYDNEKASIISRYKLVFVITSIMILFAFYLIYEIIPDRSLVWRSKTNVEKSIIVLPFKNLTPEENNQYFADGISEDILNHLSKIADFKVLSRTSAEQFRESTLSSPEIARQMNVNYILEGSVRRQNENVRISVQLIDARHDRQLWSELYDRQMADIFTIQSDIAKNVADRLQSVLSPEEIKRIEKLHTTNAEAYDYYLMGRYLWDRRTSDALQKSVAYFEKAIETDPEYALAYAGLADAYYAEAFYGFTDRHTGYNKAFTLASRALEMDKNLPEAYAVLGVVNYFGYWKWEEARELFEKALKIDSTCMVAHLYYCSFLDIVGEPNNALKHAIKANELEPFFHMPLVMKGIIYRNVKKYRESTDALKRGLELEPKRWSSYGYIFFNFLEAGDEKSAVQTLKKLFFINPKYQKYKNKLTDIYKTSGLNGVLELYLNENLIAEKQDPYLLAAIYDKLGMRKEALNYLEKICRLDLEDAPRIIRRPEYEDLHPTPRFQALVDTMNLRPYFPKPSK